MTTPIWLAAFGGFAINILHLLDYSKRPKIERPDFRDWMFWLPYPVWPVLGEYGHQSRWHSLLKWSSSVMVRG